MKQRALKQRLDIDDDDVEGFSVTKARTSYLERMRVLAVRHNATVEKTFDWVLGLGLKALEGASDEYAEDTAAPRSQ